MKKITIEKLFVIIGFIVGCLFIYIIPPFQSPDEDSHFKKAYTLSEGEFFAFSNGTISGLKIPDTMQEYIQKKVSVMSDRKWKYTYHDCYYDQLLPGEFSKKTLVEVSTSGTTPIAHIIPALGILCSKILAPVFVNGTPSTALMLHFARFFSLLAYLIIGYFAIKITPSFKKSMLTILLIPMSIFLGSMVSYDSLLISISLLSIAMILRLIYDKKTKFNKKDFILFTIIGYILLNIKVIYAPLLALLIFVPTEKFKDRKKWKTYFALGTAIILLTIVFKIPNMLLEVASKESLSSDQLMYVLSHPLSYLKILLVNLKDQFWTQLYWMTGNFGLLDTYLPPLFIFIILTNLIITFVTDGISEKIEISNKQKITIIAIFIAGIVGMYTAMYIYWTADVFNQIGGNQITGVQGRYFLPLLILLPLLCSTNLFLAKKKIMDFSKTYFNYSIIVTITCLSISLIVNITRFWI